MDMQQAIRAMTERRDLDTAQMSDVMRMIMTGEATPAQIGGFLMGLRMKGETVAEIAAAAGVMRELASAVKVSGAHLIDTCGTGGDSLSTFNISTTSAFVVAGAGGQVAKHGNRSASGSCGSADVLEALGAVLELDAGQVATCIARTGVGFMFAPRHHGAMKHAIGPRRELGVRTLFNMLGPLTNPAGAPNQVIGVYDAALLAPIAEVLARLGSDHVLVVHAADGMDEISIASPTSVAELHRGAVRCYTVTPEEFGFARAGLETLVIDTAEASCAMLLGVLDNQPGPARDIIALNAGAAIYAANLVDDLAAGVVRALEVIASGAARRKLDAFIECTRALASPA